jgi:hypothetical protein
VYQKGATVSSPTLREIVGIQIPTGRNYGIDKLWTFVLWILLTSRAIAAYDLSNKPVMALVSAIHVSEAVLFLSVLPPSKWKAEHWVVPVCIIQAIVITSHFLIA